MAELAEVEPVKKAGFVSPRRTTRNKQRIEKDEKELQELMAQQAKGKEATQEQQDAPAIEENKEDAVQEQTLLCFLQ